MFKLFESGELTAADLRFIESKLHCGVWTRKIGEDEMHWSRGMYELFDLDPHEISPTFTLYSSMMHPEDRLSIADADVRFRMGKPFNRTFRIIRKNGAIRTLSTRGEVIVDSSGRPHHAVAIVIDVTRLEEISERLKISEERLQTVAKLTEARISSLQGDGYMTLLPFQEGTDELISRFSGYEWKKMVHPDDLSSSWTKWEAAVSKNADFACELRMKAGSSEYRWRRVRGMPLLNEDGTLREYMICSIDIEREKVIPNLPKQDHTITGAQIRAGRAILNWSVRDLAEATNVSPATIRRFEETDGELLHEKDTEVIRATLTDAGVEFMFPDVGKPGVRPL